MQRLTKYSLLLKAVLKKTDDINVKKDLVEMVNHIIYGTPCIKLMHAILDIRVFDGYKSYFCEKYLTSI